MLHGTEILTYICLKLMVNVGKYSSSHGARGKHPRNIVSFFLGGVEDEGVIQIRKTR